MPHDIFAIKMIDQPILNLTESYPTIIYTPWTTFAGSTSWTFIALQYLIRDNYLRLNDHHCFMA